VRRFPCPWTHVGNLSQLEQITQTDYPFTHYEYGIKYNLGSVGAIHPVVINGWNAGLRVSVAPDYPQGDTSTGMTFGTTVFTKGLTDCNDGQWHHQYYQGGKAGGGTNGVATPELYVRRFPGLALEEKEQQRARLEVEKLAIDREKEELQADLGRLQKAAAARDATIQALRSQNAAFRDEFRRQRAFQDSALADDQQSSL